MEEKTGGKRLASDSDKGKKTAALVCGVIAVVLLTAYLALCILAGGEKLWPHTSVMGIDVSGLTATQAEERLSQAIPQQWAGKTVELYESGSGASFSLETEELMEPADLAQDLWNAQQRGNFFALGGQYLMRLLNRGEETVGVTLRYTQKGQERMDRALSQLSQKLGISGNATTYEVTDTAILFEKGITGTAVDLDAVRSGVTAALTGEGPAKVAIPLIQAPPAEPDFQAIQRGIYAQVSDAYLDRESKEIVPSVTGKDLDIEAARTALANTADGKLCRVELELTQPQVTTEELTENLFRDILGEAVTRVRGTNVRVGNVTTAAQFVDGTILFPGEEFSFNQTCSPYAVSNGYGKATAYVNGLSKDTVAGGICQASSTLYWATLKANLETLERYAHRYEPDYVSGGLDATVYGDHGESDSLDFRFRNNTEHPIKIQAMVDEKRYLHVTIYGTDETGIHGEPYSANRVITQYAQTIYEPSEAIPQGTTQKDPERTAYNAVTIDTYQKLVDAEGNEISTTFLYQSKYKVRNAVILYNPADMALWGIDPYTGIRSQEAVAPVESAPVGESPAPAEPAGEGQAPQGGQPPAETGESPVPTVDPTVPIDPPVEETPSAGEDPSDPLLPPGTIQVP